MTTEISVWKEDQEEGLEENIGNIDENITKSDNNNQDSKLNKLVKESSATQLSSLHNIKTFAAEDDIVKQSIEDSGMVWDPVSMSWKGNDAELDDFDFDAFDD
eukprot:TRINITY_DN1017_c0_g1_i2.p1 TRINITY_DN1017_c0_g1~~TRINITY_DN1017_c0_g1_i2.p1  ORF type:complete len:103 (+),score=28.24 TRINITY_DN1017_c0_g1_i2:248-556(+)